MRRLLCLRGVNGLVFGLGLMFSGCETVHEYSLTYRVWSTDDFNRWSEPEISPSLALFETPDHAKLLVVYDAYSEKQANAKRRAYYLQPNLARVEEGKAPKFVPLVVPAGMRPIPVFDAKALGTNLVPSLTNYAILDESGRTFTLYPQAEPLGALRLPVYHESSGTPVRIVLTPFAVVGDTVMVGVVASVAAVVVACSSGFRFSP
jgi:hypothetical protein